MNQYKPLLPINACKVRRSSVLMPTYSRAIQG